MINNYCRTGNEFARTVLHSQRFQRWAQETSNEI